MLPGPVQASPAFLFPDAPVPPIMPRMTRKPRLLFIQLYPSTFVEDDVEILSPRYEIARFQFGSTRRQPRWRNALAQLAAFVHQAGWLSVRLGRADLVYGWFADYHMLLPVLLARLFRRPCVVVLGGFDATALPQYRFGVFSSRWRAAAARIIVRRARFLLAVTPGLVRSENRFAFWPSSRGDGILAHVPDLHTPIEVLPTAFRPELWPMGAPARGRSVLTSAWVASNRTFLIKGLDLLIEVARRMPDTPFRVIGIHDEIRSWIRESCNPPGNLEILPPRDRFSLPSVYGEASVYLQPSRTEGGLPMALGEAMLCGCIPVASEVGGMPDTVGEAGFLAASPDPEAIAALVERALRLADDPAAGPAARERARSRILERFGWEQRRTRLIARLDEIRQGRPRRSPGRPRQA